MEDESPPPKQRSRGKIPTVERLYRENQESYTDAGGFDANDDEFEERRGRINEAKQKRRDNQFASIPKPDKCSDCVGPLYDSFLWERFSYPVCDRCRDSEGAHQLIPRTEAKSFYLLKDCDLDLRRPPLRYIAKKNPHNPRYGDMKLYLKAQLEERALQLHGGWEQLEEARQQREAGREAKAERRFESNIKRMRKELQLGSHIDPSTIGSTSKHTHDYGEEEHDEGTATYSRLCSSCGHRTTYGKL